MFSSKSSFKLVKVLEPVFSEEYKVTPIKLYFEDFITFNYGNALDKQKIEFVIYALYSKVLSGGGFYRFLK